MINFDEWVADISSKYSVSVFKYSLENVQLGCVSLKGGLEYAKKLKIPFICYNTSSDEKKKICKELNDIVGVVGISGTEPR